SDLYYYKTPPDLDLAREYLARVFQADQSAATADGKEALQLLSTIGLPSGTGTPGTPGVTPELGAPTLGAGGPATTPVPGAGTPGASTAPAGTSAPATPAAPA